MRIRDLCQCTVSNDESHYFCCSMLSDDIEIKYGWSFSAENLIYSGCVRACGLGTFGCPVGAALTDKLSPLTVYSVCTAAESAGLPCEPLTITP